MAVSVLRRQTVAAGCAVCLLLTVASALAAPASLEAAPGAVLDAVFASCAAVTNASCTVRREVTVDGRSATIVSRVDWARGDRLCVQTLSPEPKRTLIDGTNVWMKGKSDKVPRCWDVKEQAPSQVASLRSVPASAEEALASLRDFPDVVDVDGAMSPDPRLLRFSGAASGATAELRIDGNGRPVELALWPGAPEGIPAELVRFESPEEIVPGGWVFRRQIRETRVAGKTIRTISRFDDLRVNTDLPDSIFSASTVFP